MKPLQAIPNWILDQFPPGFKRSNVEVEDQYFHVMEWGEGPTVLMVHGNPTWSFLYRKIVKRLLAAKLRVITVDLIGLGFSSKPKSYSSHQLANHTRWLSELIKKMDLHEVTLVCQDWGGPISVGAFSLNQERLKNLVILNTALSPP